ncbi:unnamed protein product [[Candida] boidinii]|nr:unnamed protein product [[Candida] boidinii]
MVARLFKKRHLWRKLWFSLLFISIEGNLSLGDYKKGLPIEIDVDPTYGLSNSTWDCRLPGGVEQGVLERSFSGITLLKELQVVNNFRDSIGVYHILYKGMKYIYSIDNPPSSKDIDSILTKLLDLISNKSRANLTTAFFLKPPTVTTTNNNVGNGSAKNNGNRIDPKTKLEISIKIYKFRLYLIIKSMLFSLNYLMLLNHEQKLNKLVTEKSTTLAKIEKQKEYINVYFEGTLLLAIDNYNVFVQVYDNSDILFPNSEAGMITTKFTGNN